MRSWLWLTTGLLSALGLAAAILDEILNRGLPDFAIALLNLDQEQSLATWYSSALLALGGTLSLLMAVVPGSIARLWRILGILLWILSVDEAVRLHERSAFGIRPQGPLMFAWVVPGAIFVAAVGTWYLIRFFPQLSPSLRSRLLLAASVYVFSALGIEFLEGAIASGMIFGVVGEGTLIYQVTAFLQESLEMVGLVLFSSALLDELRGPPRLIVNFE